MIRHLPSVLFAALLALAVAAPAAGQEPTADKFRTEFNQGLELADEKLQDRAVKRGPRQALGYFEELRFEVLNGRTESEAKTDALMAAWGRAFENTETLEKLQRWTDSATKPLYDQLQKIRSNSSRLWQDYLAQGQNYDKEAHKSLMQDFQTLAKAAEGIGHYYEASELWGLASVVGSKMKDKTVEERQHVVFVIEQGIAARERWGYTFDEHYIRNKEFVKGELLAIEEARKNADARASAGYDADAKGVEALVMPNVPAARHELSFEALKDWEKDLDYGPNNGPVPPFWWLCSVGEQDTSRHLNWFRARDIYMHRTSATKFVMALDPSDASAGVELDVGSRAKPSTFYLDADRKVPYAMFFWLGSDREFVNQAECNLAPAKNVANVYYRSAASWETRVDKETLVFYDDNASGSPGDSDPFEAQFRSPMLGEYTGEGTIVPLFDSMQIGKGDRAPFSQFVQLASGWHHLEIVGGTAVSLRPLNPEYFKTGKVKLSWDGPKASAPETLDVQGRGDFRPVCCELAGMEEVELPVGDYSVIFGRLVNGKGSRTQMATLYPGADSKPFTVEAGKTTELEMGAPFRLEFEREGDGAAVTIDALKVHVADRSGCRIGSLHGSSLACDVSVARDADGKGAKAVDKLMPFTDPELVNKAAGQYPKLGLLVACFPMPKGYQEGAMTLKVELPDPEAKVGLVLKKHPLFGKLETVWK